MIRPARPGEADGLTDLALRSKGHWGYPDAWMQAWRDELRVTDEAIARGDVFVCEDDGRLVGVSALSPQDGDDIELDLLFIDPDVIGCGHGRVLFEHAVEAARRRGASILLIESDPDAERFYLRMGAVRIGERPSKQIEGRHLPLLSYRLR